MVKIIYAPFLKNYHFKNITKTFLKWHELPIGFSDLHWCTRVEYCFCEEKSATTILPTTTHIHFNKSLVSIGRGEAREYPMSKLEFILRFPNLWKKLEKLKMEHENNDNV